jgi:N-acetyl-gamma-glutamyl-phosphate reductase
MASNKLRVAILGASGYTGAELVRLLSRHPQVAIVALTADRQAGKPAAEVFPQLVLQELPTLTKIDDVDWSGVDFAFCCLPHGLTQEVIAKLPRHLKIVDLSADFRLTDVEAYATWYGHAHHAPDLQKEAVYGLTEIKREAVRTARLVANPGCYPTAAILALAPLARAGLLGEVVIDAKSGASGAGREPTHDKHFVSVDETVTPYKVGAHRHSPEIAQELGVPVTFTPHLVPLSHGELVSCYVRTDGDVDAPALYRDAYADEPWVEVVEGPPGMTEVRETNFCRISIHEDPLRLIVFATIDNLYKGTSSQAVQNLNLMFGLDESMGLPA